MFVFLRFWLTLAMRLWYRRAFVHFEAPLPTDGPIIFACTHPNSAVDYLFAPIIHGMPTYVLVRGDVFENPILDKIFRAIYMLPVYRFRDGYASLNRNQDSFKACYDHFDRMGKVLIFSEGICYQTKELEPLRKGTARLALDYLAKHGGEKVYIVPVAGNYTRFRQFRSSVMVNYLAPIDARAYLSLYQENANKAYERLTSDLEGQLASAYITMNDYSDAAFIEQALMIDRLDRSWPGTQWQMKDKSHFDREKLASTSLDTSTHEALLAPNRPKVQASDDGLLSVSDSWVLSLVKVLILLPVVIAGALTVTFPYLMGRLVIKNWIKDVIFDNTVMVMGGAVLYFLQLVIITLIAWTWMSLWALALAIGIIAITMLGVEVIDTFLVSWRRVKRRKELDALTQLMHEYRAALGLV